MLFTRCLKFLPISDKKNPKQNTQEGSRKRYLNTCPDHLTEFASVSSREKHNWQLQKSLFSLQNQGTSEDGQEAKSTFRSGLRFLLCSWQSSNIWSGPSLTAQRSSRNTHQKHYSTGSTCLPLQKISCAWHFPPTVELLHSLQIYQVAIPSQHAIQKITIKRKLRYRATSENANSVTHTLTNAFFLYQCYPYLLGSRMAVEKSISWYAKSLQTQSILNTKQCTFTAVDLKRKKAQVAENQFPTPMPGVCTK